MDNMEENAVKSRSVDSRVVTLTVEQGEDGLARLVLEGAYMSTTGFVPGDHVDAIVQPELISILHPE
ncbi:MAG TPA: hypothetical protein VF267_08030 [Gammaproteobacteria bacterium]